MIFYCADCKKEILNIKTPGNEINRSFICPACAEHLKRDITKQALQLKKRIHEFYHSN